MLPRKLFSRRRCVIPAGLLVLLFIHPALAADPAKLVPPDALAYVGWSKMIEPQGPTAAHIRRLALALRDQSAKDGVDDLAHLAEAVEIGIDLASATVGGGFLEFALEDSVPRVSMSLVIADLPDPSGMEQRITKLLKESKTEFKTQSLAGGNWQTIAAPNEKDELHIGRLGDRIVFAFGEKTVEHVAKTLASGGASMADSAALGAVRKLADNAVKGETASAFLDLKRIIGLARGFLAEAPAEEKAKIEKVFTESGFGALSAFYIRHHQDQRTAEGVNLIQLDASANQGLFKFYRPKPLDPQQLALIPSDATWASAASFDAAEYAVEFRRMMAAIDPEEAAQIDAALNAARQMIGFSLTDDLLPILGREFTLFDAPSHGGILFTGAVGLLHPKDAAGLEDMLMRFVQMAAPVAAQASVDIKQLSLKDGSREIKYLMGAGLPIPIAPAWTTVRDRLVVGLFPQTVAAAARRVESASVENCILANPDVKEALAPWPKALDSLGYFDVKQFGGQVHAICALLTTAIDSFAGKRGATIDFAWLPPYPEIRPTMKGIVTAGWHDADAVYGAYRGDATAGAVIAGGAGVLMAPILLPSLANARNEAKAALSRSNLRQIGMACHMYANANGDKFPPDLDTLVAKGMLPRAVLNSPLDWNRDRVSYTYIGRSANDNPADVLAFEQMLQGAYLVAFVDGHVDKMEEWDFLQRIRETYQRQGRSDQLPAEFKPVEDPPQADSPEKP